MGVLVIVISIWYLHGGENAAEEEGEYFNDDRVFVKHKLRRAFVVLHNLEKLD